MRKVVASIFIVHVLAILSVAPDDGTRTRRSAPVHTNTLTTIPYKSIQIYVYAAKSNEFQEPRQWSFYYAPVMQPKLPKSSAIQILNKNLHVTLTVGNEEINRIVLNELKKKFPPPSSDVAGSWTIAPLMMDAVTAYIVKSPDSPVTGVTTFRTMNPKGLNMNLRFTCANKAAAEDIADKLLEGTLEIEMFIKFAGMGRAESSFPAITSTNLRDVAQKTVADGRNGNAQYIHRHQSKQLISTYMNNVKSLVLTGSRKNMFNIADMEEQFNSQFLQGLEQSQATVLAAGDYRQVWWSDKVNPAVIEAEINKKFTYKSGQQGKTTLQINRHSLSQSGVFPSLVRQYSENSEGHISFTELNRTLAEHDVYVQWTGRKVEVKSFRVFQLMDLIEHLEVALVTKQLVADKSEGSIANTVNLMDPMSTDADSQGSISGLAPGQFHLYTGQLPPPRPWLVCDGSAVFREQYRRLFRTLGEKYGRGDGTTTFNLPHFPSVDNGGTSAVFVVYSGLSQPHECESTLEQEIRLLRKSMEQVKAKEKENQEDRNFVQAPLRISFKRFTDGPTRCAYQSFQVKKRFLPTASKRASNAYQCALNCQGSDVFQFNNATSSCSCTSIKGRYLVLFPRRYIECNHPSSQQDIFYNDASVHADLMAIGTPQLFYPLDNVSETDNIGSLEEDRYNVEWQRNRRSFNCPWRGDTTSNRRRLLRMNPNDHPLLRVRHGLNPQSYTWIAWFNQRDPKSKNMPIIQATPDDDSQSLWYIRSTGNNTISWNLNNSKKRTSLKFNTKGWNLVAVRVQPDGYYAQLNQKDVFTRFSSHYRNAVSGETVTFGGRYVRSDTSYVPSWDGCLGHFMFFNRTLNKNEVQLMASVISNRDF